MKKYAQRKSFERVNHRKRARVRRFKGDYFADPKWFNELMAAAERAITESMMIPPEYFR